MQVIQEFTLKQTTVVCPACNSLFSTPVLVSMPDITQATVIEADLHRVLPHQSLRSSLVAMCAACNYTWWVTAFKTHLVKPQLVPATPASECPKKFAHAVLTGRQNQAHCLDLALLALNGYWCAREAGEPHERWLDLSGQEMEKALKDTQWQGNRGYYHYVMGEICRLVQDFKGAVANFVKVGPQSMLPLELIERQKVLSTSGDHNPAILPVHLVELMFCPNRQLEIIK
ncbi:MAG: hypothetical protein HY711_11090 [Candidatus Melainabacteria bacterium]|nr:hypothetical protein [Candidatus Melainabacteria bacterium]